MQVTKHWRILKHFLQVRPYSNVQQQQQQQPALHRGRWEAVVGLEVHAQITTATKLFTRVGAEYAAPPNTRVGIFEAAHPGTLPVLNKRCAEAGIKTALALGATVNKVSRFDRKHYFYPDLPAGYQITQSDLPLASNGRLEFYMSSRGERRRHAVRLVQLQLEEDSGKSQHEPTSNRILVDLNRAGLPLMELVFSPDLHSGEEAAAMVREVMLILTTLRTCDCHMHEGSLRVDANISVHEPGHPLGTRSEVKNLGSLQSLVRAVDYEIERQIDILESGGKVISETRNFDVFKNETVSMRDKEVTHDYRFMPEPNLLPLRLHDSAEPDCRHDGVLDINDVRASLPELPEARRQRLVREHGITLDSAVRLMSEDALMDFFLSVVRRGDLDPKVVCNLLFNDLLRVLNIIEADITSSPLSASGFSELVELRQSSSISSSVAQEVMRLVVVQGDQRSPSQIVQDNKWVMVSDEPVLEALVDRVLGENPHMVDLYHRRQQKKKKRVMNGLVELVKEASGHQANLAKVHDILVKKLET